MATEIPNPERNIHLPPPDWGAVIGNPENVLVRLTDVIQLIDSPYFQKDVQEGNIAFMFIRPHAEIESKGVSDIDARKAIYDYINEFQNKVNQAEKLEIVATSPFRFSQEHFLEHLDPEVREKLKEIPPMYPDRFVNKLDEFVDLNTDGDSTLIILRSKDGKACDHARDMAGRSFRVAENSQDSIRRKFAENDYNNKVHCSDSSASAARELALVSKFGSRYIVENRPSIN